MSTEVSQYVFEWTALKSFLLSQRAKIEVTLYKDQQFATKQDQHFVLTKIPVFDIKIEIILLFFSQSLNKSRS